MSSQKKMDEMMNKMGRMALIVKCQNIQEALTQETPEANEMAIKGAAATLIGICAIVHKEAAMEHMHAAIMGVLNDIKAMHEAEENEPDSAPEPAEEPEAPEVPEPPSAKGMTDEEIAHSMGIVLGNK